MREPGSRAVGPIVLVLPILTAVLAIAVLRQLQHVRPAVEAPVPDDREALVDGWRARAERPDGSVLEAVLVPLRSAPDRQAFEAEALRRRLDLGPGGPWRLSLVRLGGGSEPLDLATLRVFDEQGLALAPIPADGPADSGAAGAEPLRVLLAPPAHGLAPDRRAELCLWGRGPGAPDTTVLLHVGEGPAATLSLEPCQVPRADLPQHLARLDADRLLDEVSGKDADAPSSDVERTPRGF